MSSMYHNHILSYQPRVYVHKLPRRDHLCQYIIFSFLSTCSFKYPLDIQNANTHNPEATLVRKRLPPDQKKPFPSGKYNGAPIQWTQELIDKETQALFEWQQLDTSYKLLDFCNSRELILDDMQYFESICPRFSRTLKMAKQKIAANREEMVNKEQLNYGVYNRYAALYDPLLNHYERAEKAYEAELKKQIVAGSGGNVTLNITDYGK